MTPTDITVKESSIILSLLNVLFMYWQCVMTSGGNFLKTHVTFMTWSTVWHKY